MNEPTLKKVPEMQRTKERTVWSVLLAIVLVVSLGGYLVYVQRQFYYESTKNLLETYEQVDKTFTMFAQRNWNVLREWGKTLENGEDSRERWSSLRQFSQEKETWQYSGLYLFNEECLYLNANGDHGTAKHLWGAFAEMYTTGEPSVASYTMKNGERRVVFTVPISPTRLYGETYTCIAVSYDNETLEEMIGGHAYNGQSDCYIVHSDGRVMLSEEPKSEIEPRMENLFDFLEENARVNKQHFAEMRTQVQKGISGSVEYRYNGKNYYLVYRPVGFQDLTIVGIVDRDVVDDGMQKIQTATILLLFFVLGTIAFTLVRFIKLNAQQEVAEKENALRAEESERRKMEDLANRDGLTGLLNERCFNRTLKEKEEEGQPFTLFYLDLDKFKPVNDTYGHDMGDQLLKAVAGRLRGCVRSTDLAFRIGGDEFALIVNGERDEGWCRERVEKIKSIIRQPYLLDQKTIVVGTSCGFSLYPADSADVRTIRILADHRMYEDKERTGNGRG